MSKAAEKLLGFSFSKHYAAQFFGAAIDGVVIYFLLRFICKIVAFIAALICKFLQ
ncbi:MAG: hypothetical protein R3Y50_08765 [Rikenellaceae bacterium]